MKTTKQKITLAFVLLSSLLLAACANDKIDGPCKGITCPDGQTCNKGKCESKPSNDEACKDITCPDGQTCNKGKCEPKSSNDEACKDITCPDGQTCNKGKCEPKSGNDEACKDITCPDGQTCNKGKCEPISPKKQTKPGESCENNDDCIESAHCSQNDKLCMITLEIDQPCDTDESPEYSECNPQNSLCLKNLCTKAQQPGEQCNNTDKLCVPNTECSNKNICIKNVNTGDSCNDFTICPSTDLCHKGICTPSQTENQQCDDQKPCANGLLCFDNLCIKDLGQCTSDAQCAADTYCCTMPECQTKNICLPYGVGPIKDINEACVFQTKPGLFEADVQCEWIGPNNNTATNTVTVGKLQTPDGPQTAIAFVAGSNVYIIDGQTCKTIYELTEIPGNSWSSGVALADLNKNGNLEIVTYAGAYTWDDAQKKYIVFWKAERNLGNTTGYGSASSPIIHDINNDNIPEIIGGDGTVLNGLTGKLINKDQGLQSGSIAIVADFDQNGSVDIVANNGIYSWRSDKWEKTYDGSIGAQSSFFAIADFGTPADPPTSFNFAKLDGKAEIVASGGDKLEIYQLLNGKVLTVASVSGFQVGGPPTVGDFNNDKFPEVAVASHGLFGVYDPKCKAPNNPTGCQDKFKLWEKYSQDHSSGRTGSSLFDFDGDGQSEAVYADECYTRVYDGKTGEVLFSFERTSGTGWESPAIADVDGDGSAEIVMPSDSTMSCASIDPIHRGVKCISNDDCFSNKCHNGLCRCNDNKDCNKGVDKADKNDYQCTTPLKDDKDGGNVCRAIHTNKNPRRVTILRDRLDRWVSARSLWNQHAYVPQNINDDGTIPKTSSWVPAFKNPAFNNFRQNSQGLTGAGKAPDITGKFTQGDVCKKTKEGKIEIKAVICNRGTKAVASKMPASFYLNEIKPENILCVSYTQEHVPVGQCREVICSPNNSIQQISGKIILEVNKDQNGARTTVECNYDNNKDEISITGCDSIIN